MQRNCHSDELRRFPVVNNALSAYSKTGITRSQTVVPYELLTAI